MSENLLTKLTKTAQTDTHALTELFRGKPKQVLELARERNTLHLSLFIGAIIATNVFANYEYGDGAALAREAPGATHKVELVNQNNKEVIKGFGNVDIPLSAIEKHKDLFSICSNFRDFRFSRIGFRGCTSIIGTKIEDTTLNGGDLSQEAYEKLNNLGLEKVFWGFYNTHNLENLTEYVTNIEGSLTGNSTAKLRRNNQSGREVTERDFNPEKLTYLVTGRIPESFDSIGQNVELINLSSKLEIGKLDGGTVINGYSTKIGTVNGKVITNYTNNLSDDKALTINEQTGGWIIWQMGDEPQMPAGLQAFLDSKQAELKKLIESENTTNSNKTETNPSNDQKIEKEERPNIIDPWKIKPKESVDIPITNSGLRPGSLPDYTLPFISTFPTSSTNNAFKDAPINTAKGLIDVGENTGNGIFVIWQAALKASGLWLNSQNEIDRAREKSEAITIITSTAPAIAATGAGCALGGALAAIPSEGALTSLGCSMGSTVAGDIYSFFTSGEGNIRATLSGGDKNASVPQMIGYQLGDLGSNFLGAKALGGIMEGRIPKAANFVDDITDEGRRANPSRNINGVEPSPNKPGSGIDACAAESIDVEAGGCSFDKVLGPENGYKNRSIDSPEVLQQLRGEFNKIKPNIWKKIATLYEEGKFREIEFTQEQLLKAKSGEPPLDPVTKKPYEIHHIVPISYGDGQLNGQFVKGGTNDLSNLTILDQQSHRGKGNATANHTPPFNQSSFGFTLDQYITESDLKN